jgi:tryptophan synthase alpha chain
MNLRILFRKKKEKHEKVLSCFLTAGYPTREATVPLVRALAEGGADLIELGIPFSDPLADGPIIQRSSMRALQQGVTLPWVLKTAAELIKELDIPILLMGYMNPVLAYGAENFLRAAKESGVAALIIPDLPIDEEAELWRMAAKIGVPFVPFVSPTTDRQRFARIDRRAQAFIYAVSITGVTGARESLPAKVEKYLVELAPNLTAPTLVGFGISNPEEAARMARFADGIIVGSALLKQIDENGDIEENCRRAQQFVREIKKAISCPSLTGVRK